MAVRQVGDIGSAQNEPVFLSNTDCDLITYRVPNSSTMQTGCFSATAFGLMDSDTDVVIFNGTDEGLPLMPYAAHDALVPWSGALDLISLNAAVTGGSYVGVYKNPLAVMKDQRNYLDQLTGKQLTAPAELQLQDQRGRRLLVNPQTMAFSSNGSWLVVETVYGVFVRINLATLDVTAFAPAYTIAGNPALLKS